MADFYLASHSARRREPLRQVGARFETLLLRVVPPRGPDVSEQQAPGETPADYVARVAREKAMLGMEALLGRSLLPRPILSADTIVVIDGEILGKPEDARQAAQFLARLAGRTHEVRTAIALAVPGSHALQAADATVLPVAASVSSTQVTMRAIADD